MTDESTVAEDDFIGLTTEIVAAYVSNNPVPVSDLPSLIANTHAALSGLGSSARIVAEEKLTPAVSIRKSVTPDFLICLEDGKSSNHSSVILRPITI